MPGPRSISPPFRPHEEAAAGPAAPPHLTYHNGPLLTAVEVYTIFWGSAWQQAPQNALANQLNQFFDFILTSPLIDVLAEYSVPGKAIGHGRRTGTTTIATEPGRASRGGRVVTDAQIQTALQGWLAARTVPQPNANTLFFVYLPPNVTSSMGRARSCTVYCGYHSNVGANIFYAVEPYLTCQGCTFGNGGALDSLTKVSSHELCEAITDPAGSGWYDDASGEEIGDICNGNVQQLGQYFIQGEWSNNAGACKIRP